MQASTTYNTMKDTPTTTQPRDPVFPAKITNTIYDPGTDTRGPSVLISLELAEEDLTAFSRMFPESKGRIPVYPVRDTPQQFVIARRELSRIDESLLLAGSSRAVFKHLLEGRLNGKACRCRFVKSTNTNERGIRYAPNVNILPPAEDTNSGYSPELIEQLLDKLTGTGAGTGENANLPF